MKVDKAIMIIWVISMVLAIYVNWAWIQEMRQKRRTRAGFGSNDGPASSGESSSGKEDMNSYVANLLK